MVLLKYPIVDMKDNILLTDQKEVMAYYKISNKSITIVDEVTKLKHRVSIAQMLRKFQDNEDFEIRLVPRDFLAVEKFRDLVPALAPEYREIGINYFGRLISELNNEIYIPYRYEWILGVKIKEIKDTSSVKDVLSQKINENVSNLVEKLGYEIEGDSEWFEKFEEPESQMYQYLQAFGGRRLTQKELYYAQSLQFLRYIPHEKEDVIANSALRNITDVSIKKMKNGILELNSFYGTSYISILPIGHIPIITNGLAIFDIVQRFNFPVEMILKSTNKNSDEATREKGRSKTRVSNIAQEAYNTGSTQQDIIIETAMGIESIEKEIGNKEPLYKYGDFLIVSAQSVEQLKARRKIVLSTFDNLRIDVYTANLDTIYLFQSLLIGQKYDSNTRKWEHIATSEGLADQMMFSGSSSGSNTGLYLGRVDNNFQKWDDISEAVYASKNIVLYNMTLGNKDNIRGKITKNPHMIITGETGGGKSYLTQNLLFSHALLNTKVLYIDPKSELRKHYQKLISNPNFRKKYPDTVKFIESFNFVTLDIRDKSNVGVLDPILILEEEDAISTAKSMIEYLSGGTNYSRADVTAIKKSIKEVLIEKKEGKIVGFKHVIDKLIKSKDKEISELGEYLFETIDGSMLELAFSDGKSKGLSYNERVSIIEIAGLKLPKNSQDNLSDTERDSIALMMSLGAFCARFGERNKQEETIEFFDEAWVLLGSKEGRDVIKTMRRTGRSANNTLALVD